MDTKKPNQNIDDSFDEAEFEKEYQKLFNNVSDLFGQIVQLSWQTTAECRPIVNDVIKTGCRDENFIAHLFDRLNDCGRCPAGWKLFNRLTKYCDTFAPRLSASYREFWYDEYINENTADLDGEGWDW